MQDLVNPSTIPFHKMFKAPEDAPNDQGEHQRSAKRP